MSKGSTGVARLSRKHPSLPVLAAGRLRARTCRQRLSDLPFPRASVRPFLLLVAYCRRLLAHPSLSRRPASHVEHVLNVPGVKDVEGDGFGASARQSFGDFCRGSRELVFSASDIRNTILPASKRRTFLPQKATGPGFPVRCPLAPRTPALRKEVAAILQPTLRRFWPSGHLASPSVS